MLPEHCKVPLAAVSLRPTHKVLIVLVDSIVGQVHVGRLQVAGLQAPDLDCPRCDNSPLRQKFGEDTKDCYSMHATPWFRKPAGRWECDHA